MENGLKLFLRGAAWILVLALPTSLATFLFSDEVVRKKIVVLIAIDAAPFVGCLLYLGNVHKNRIPDIRSYATRHPKMFLFFVGILPALFGFLVKNFVR